MLFLCFKGFPLIEGVELERDSGPLVANFGCHGPCEEIVVEVRQRAGLRKQTKV